MAKKKHTTRKVIPLRVKPDTKDDDTAHEADKDDTLANALRLGTQGVELKPITSLADLLGDRESLIKVAAITSSGGSIDTVEMSLGLPPGMVRGWLMNGKQGPSEANSPFYAFYVFYTAAAAEAKLSAEASLLNKNPAAWLDRLDILKQLNINPNPEGDAIETTATPSVESHVGFKEFPSPKTK